jgi:exportin-7
VLCAAHTHVIAACDTPTFAFLITALDSGLKSLDVVVSSQCAAAVDNLAGFYFRAVQATAGETPSPTAQVARCLLRRPGHAHAAQFSVNGCLGDALSSVTRALECCVQ